MAYINGNEILFTPIVSVTTEQELIPITVESLLAEVELPSTSTDGKYDLEPIDVAALGFETPLTKLGVQFIPYREEEILTSSNGLVDIKTKAYGAITMWYIGNMSLYDKSAENTGERYLLLGIGNDDILGSTDMAFYCTDNDGTIYTRDGTLFISSSKTEYVGELDMLVEELSTRLNALENSVEDLQTEVNSHDHTTSEITDFPTSMTPTAHSHTTSEITDFPTTETWTFTLEDGSTVTKAVYVG